MIKIRLKRCGRKKYPVYRIVLMNSMSKRDGRALEELGFYNPITNAISLNLSQLEKRLQQGAQPTNTVKNMLQKAQIIKG
uniref:Small ribosomal subunit protein bS16c n=1 Tax=Corynoplastis japonica TaxID=700918 RepID=A0A1X9PU17_9RHOD|nr:30S ribosomal protein S16 [Corynoplastis japonica]